jgi:hypothetical protein
VQAAAFSITDALLERFGLLIIIVLGETVTGVVDGLAHTPVDMLTLVVALVAVVTGFGAWWTYFDFAGHRPPRRPRPPTLVWILTQLPLTAVVATMGAAMVSLTEHARAADIPRSHRLAAVRRRRRRPGDNGVAHHHPGRLTRNLPAVPAAVPDLRRRRRSVPRLGCRAADSTSAQPGARRPSRHSLDVRGNPPGGRPSVRFLKPDIGQVHVCLPLSLGARVLEVPEVVANWRKTHPGQDMRRD